MSEEKLNKKQLLDNMADAIVVVNDNSTYDEVYKALHEITKISEALQESAGPEKRVAPPLKSTGVPYVSVKRAPKEDLKDWKDPYARESKEPRWWERKLTPAELQEHAEKYRAREAESAEIAKNMPRRVRLDCFLSDWRTAAALKKVKPDECIDELYESLCNDEKTHSYSLWSSSKGSLIADIEKIEKSMRKYGAVVSFAITELRKAKAHPSLSTKELMLINSDWGSNVVLEEQLTAFNTLGILAELPETPKEEQDTEASLLAAALFDDTEKLKEKMINNMAAELITEFDANLLGGLDERRVHLFKKLAKTSYDLAEITQELFQKREETEVERRRRLRREEVLANGAAIQRSQPIEKAEESLAEENIGWKTPLASLLVAAVAKAAQTHFQKDNVEKVEISAEVQSVQ